MRRPIGLPHTRGASMPTDDLSESSISQPIPSVPLHDPAYKRDHRKTTTRVRQRHQPETRHRTSKPRELRRSKQLQTAMDRIHHYQESEGNDASSPIRLEQASENPEQVGRVLEMFSTYDSILDHLVRKNRRLKSYVRKDSDQYPSEATYATADVRDTLETLKREREDALKAPARPWPKKVGNSKTRKKTYPRSGGTSRPTYQSQDKDHDWEEDHCHRRSPRQRPLAATGTHAQGGAAHLKKDRSPGRRVNFATEGGQRATRLQPYAEQDYRQQAQDLLELMRGYKYDGFASPQRGIQSWRYGENDGGGEIFDSNEHKTRENLEYLHHYTSSESPLEEDYDPDDSVGRWNDPDPIELLRSKDFDYGDGSIDMEIHGYDTCAGQPTILSDGAESYATRDSPRKLLPEKLPPKIKASRERIAESRRRLHFLQNLRSKRGTVKEYSKGERRQCSPSREGTLGEMRQGAEGYPRYQQYRYRCDPGSWHASTTRVRRGSPEKPLAVTEYDGHGRCTEILEDSDAIDQNERSQTRFSSGRYPPGRDKSRFSEARRHNGQRIGKRQCYTGMQVTRSRSAPRSSRIQDPESEGSSGSPTEKARHLKDRVESVYLDSKKLSLSHDQLKDELLKIKQKYHSRSNSINDRALRAKSSSFEGSKSPPMKSSCQKNASYPSQEHGYSGEIGVFSAVQLSSMSSEDRLRYRPRDTFLPARQRQDVLETTGSPPFSKQALSYSGLQTDYVNGINYVTSRKTKEAPARLPTLQQVVAEFNENDQVHNSNPIFTYQQLERQALFDTPRKREDIVMEKQKAKDKVASEQGETYEEERALLGESFKLIQPPRYVSESPIPDAPRTPQYKEFINGGLETTNSVESCHKDEELHGKYVMSPTGDLPVNEKERALLRRSNKSLVPSSSDSNEGKEASMEKVHTPQLAEVENALYDDPIFLPDKSQGGGCCHSLWDGHKNRKAVQTEVQPGCMPCTTRH